MKKFMQAIVLASLICPAMAAALAPAPVPVSFGRACLETVLSDPDTAIAECTWAIDSQRLSDLQMQWAFRLRGIAHEQKRDLDLAIADLDEALRRDPSDAAALNVRGNVWYYKGQLDKALADYDEALRIAPKLATAYVNRGNVFRDRNQWVEAAAQYDQAIQVDPRMAVAYVGRSLVQARLKNDDAALTDLGMAIRLDPDNASNFNTRAHMRFERHEYDKAMADFDAAVRLSHSADSFYFRGEAWLRRRHYDKALADFDEAIRLAPQSANALVYRARAHDGLGQCEAALADSEAALRIAPNSTFTLRSRSDAHFCMHDVKAALGDIEALLKIEPMTLSQRDLGWYRFEDGDYDGGAKALRAAVDAEPDKLYYALWLYLVRARSSQPEEAPAELAAATTHRVDGAWPAPVVGLYSGRLSPSEVFEAANDADPKKEEAQRCEANFYVAEWLLVKHDSVDAMPLLQAAVHGCPRTFYEYDSAVAELDRQSR